MKFDIWSVLIIVFVFQGLFIAISLLVSAKRRRKTENTYLFFIILCIVWYLAEFLAVRNKFDIGIPFFFGTRYGSWFLIGPLTYFYFYSITDRFWKFSKKHLLLFMPFLLSVILLPLFFNEVISSRQVDYGMLSVFDHREKIISPVQYLYSFIFIIQFIHFGFYVFKNLNLVKRYELGLASVYADIDLKVRWLKIFNVLFLLILILAAVFLYILLVSDIYERYLDYIYVLPMGVLFYLISYYLMGVEWKTIDEKITKYAGSSLPIENVPLYKQRLDNLIRNEKIYLNPKIHLADLSDRLELKTHHVSQLINQYYGLSFFDFINGFRIEEAKNIIKQNPMHTLLEVSFQSGFNNKTSFLNAFKKFEKITPSQYREQARFS
jgi:AraC-like DNA-binding protein